MKTSRERIQDMIGAIDAITAFSIASYEEFSCDARTQDAVMFNLIILGEAANRLGEVFHEAHPQIPWSSIIGTRNVIVHGYDQVRLRILWDIIQKNLPELKEMLISLL